MSISHCYQSKHQLKVTVKEPLNLTKKKITLRYCIKRVHNKLIHLLEIFDRRREETAEYRLHD